ncbi:MAG: hypothetical protein EOO39_40930 [Cytophagaceae bacterium]|nr:MAG: hypothetical protein EOO39_40930 [Cytophagaceae bacterium]
MAYWVAVIGGFSLGLLVGCQTGVRDLDFTNKRFGATFNIDSTKGIDSTNLAMLSDSKAVYSFSEDGKGINHIQMGMLSKDTPFIWKVQGDSLLMDNKRYLVKPENQGFVLKSDSAKIFLIQQP